MLRLEMPSKIISHSLSRAPRCHILMVLKSPQGWRLHHCPEHPLPMFNNLHGDEIFLLPSLNVLPFFSSGGLKTTRYNWSRLLVSRSSNQPFNFEFLLYLRLQANKKKKAEKSFSKLCTEIINLLFSYLNRHLEFSVTEITELVLMRVSSCSLKRGWGNLWGQSKHF